MRAIATKRPQPVRSRGSRDSAKSAMSEPVSQRAIPANSAPPGSILQESVPLESILCTEELERRPSRPPDYRAENRALTRLVQALADEPLTILQTLADTILEVFQTGSAGVSVLNREETQFVWAAIAGGWKPLLGGGTPRDFGPCGDVVDRNAPLLFQHWERRYPYLLEATPLAEEGLLVPFSVAGRPVGTIWAIAHDNRRKFDAEDLRQLETLGRFAAAAYQSVEIENAEAARRAALNLMEDAVQSSQTVEALNRELRDSERRLHTMIDGLPVAVYTVDAAGSLTHFNPAAVALVGRTPKVGQDKWCVCWKLFELDGTPVPLENCLMAIAIREDRDVGPAHVIVERPDGTRRWIEAFPTRLRDAEGRTIGGVNMIIDVTERRKSEAALIQSEKLAASGRLAAALAHEINNPLQAVTNLLDLIGKSPRLDQQDEKYARLATEELERVAHLTRQSLSFYRENRSSKITDVVVREVFDSVLSIYARRIEAKKIVLTKRYDPEIVVLQSYPGEIRQVFATLLLNAVDAVPEGGAIDVRIHKVPRRGERNQVDGLQIVVADNGPGIPPRSKAHIFEAFYTTKGDQGTGLGLWVAQAIVKRLGGSIQVRSATQKGKCGAIFSVNLPIRIPDNPEPIKA